jgi:hypothetical protein
MATAPEPPARRHDPLLARVAFLDALPPAEGRRVLSGIDAALASELERWQSAPPSEGSRGVMRRAAIEEREALRRFLAREREPVIQSPGRGPRRVSTRRRAGTPARRKG